MAENEFYHRPKWNNWRRAYELLVGMMVFPVLCLYVIWFIFDEGKKADLTKN